MTNPIDDAELYSIVILAGEASPGVVTLTGHDRKIGWDIKKGSGQTGASMTRTSEDPVAFTASFYLANEEQFAEWEVFLALVNSTVSGAAPRAMEIYHPDLASQDIGAVVKDTVLGTVHDGKGGKTVAVKFIEYKPPKPKGGSPNGSKTSATAKKKADPNQAALDELARLTQQYKDTPWG